MDWKNTEDYDLSDDMVQVLCRVTDYDPGTPPRAVNLPVSSGDHGVGDLFVSIGWRDDNERVWRVAGWNMSQDCWQDANCFEVVGWKPMSDPPGVTLAELSPNPFPRRCETGLSVEMGECEFCGAAEGQACLKPKS